VRIVHYISELRLAHGGVVRCVIDLCDALARVGHDVTVITFDPADVPATWSRGDAPPAPGASTPRAAALNWPRFPKPIRQFRRADLVTATHAIRGADVLHLHVPWEPTNLQLAAIAGRERIPYILSTHGMLDDWTIAQGLPRKRLYLALAGRRLLSSAASVLCTADAERDQARKWFTNPRIDVLPLLMDLAPFASRPDPAAAATILDSIPGRADWPVALFLSRLHPKKGLEVLIDAIALLKQRDVNLRLAIAGKEDIAAPGYEQGICNRIIAANISDRAALLGMVTGPARDALLAAATIHALPTSQENWGFSLIESLAAATPVITTRGVDIWRELQATGGALIADQTPQAFADAIAQLAADPARARSMGNQGRDWVLRELDPPAVLARYERFYESIAQR
jgi:glycosyltransferase involved in cell wall biosynthesis